MLSLGTVLQGRVIDYWLEKAGRGRGETLGPRPKEAQAGLGSQLISLSLENAELNLEQGSD